MIDACVSCGYMRSRPPLLEGGRSKGRKIFPLPQRAAARFFVCGGCVCAKLPTFARRRTNFSSPHDHTQRTHHWRRHRRPVYRRIPCSRGMGRDGGGKERHHRRRPADVPPRQPPLRDGHAHAGGLSRGRYAAAHLRVPGHSGPAAAEGGRLSDGDSLRRRRPHLASALRT